MKSRPISKHIQGSSKSDLYKKMTVVYVIHDLLNGGTSKYLLDLLRYSSIEYNNIVVCFSDKNEFGDELKKLNTLLVVVENKNKTKMIYDVIRKNKVDIVYAVSY